MMEKMRKDPKLLKACTDEAYFFIQYVCMMPEGEYDRRQRVGLFLSCMCIFIYFFNQIYFDYIDAFQKNKYIDYDFKTITAGDYTVEFDITPTQYDNWKTNYHDLTNPMSEMAQFKQYIQMEFEERVQRIEPQL